MKFIAATQRYLLSLLILLVLPSLVPTRSVEAQKSLVSRTDQ